MSLQDRTFLFGCFSSRVVEALGDAMNYFEKISTLFSKTCRRLSATHFPAAQQAEAARPPNSPEAFERWKTQHESHAFFDLTFELLGFFSTSGIILDINRTSLTLLGISRDDVLGRPVWETPWWSHSKEMQNRLKVAIQTAAHGQFTRFEALHYDYENKAHIIDFSLKPIEDSQGNVMLLIAEGRDITERKQAEKALQESHQKLLDIIDFLPDATFVVDTEKRIIAWNRAIEEMTGIKKENMLGQGDEAYSIPFYGERRKLLLDLLDEANPALEAQYQHLVRKGDMLFAEVFVPALYGGRGAYVWVTNAPLYDPQGNRVGAIESIRDITERKKAEEALQESRQKLLDIIDFLPDATFVVDKDKRIIAWNKAIEEMTGIRKEKMIGLTDSEYTIPFYGNPRLQLLDLLDEASPLLERHYEHLTRKGNTIYAETFLPAVHGGKGAHVWITNAPLFDPQGNRVGAIESIRDITDRKQAETDRNRLENHVRQSQKLESLGILAGGIAHDFNNMLMVILGNIELTLEEVAPDAPFRPLLEEATNTAQHAAALCLKMLAYSGKGHFAMKPVHLSSFVLSMKTVFEDAIPRTATLHYQLDEHVPSIEADELQLHQLMLSLLTNAAEALGDTPGQITASTGTLFCDQQYLEREGLQGETTEGSYVFLEIADTGCGFDPITREKLFDPFFTTKFPGRGLGLAAVQGIVRGHKGLIEVHSVLGQGTSFRVLFPCTPNLETPLPQEKEVVLVVDDEERLRKICRQALERNGFEVLVAEEGQEALQLLKDHHDRIHCVLLDLSMPTMGGKEVYQALQEIVPGIKVVLTSGYNEREAMNQFNGMPIAGFLPKPFRIADLTSIIKTALAMS